MLVYVFKDIRCFFFTQQMALQARWLSLDHSQRCTSLLLKCGNGEKGQWRLGKRCLSFHLCVHHASRQTSHYRVTGSDWKHDKCASSSVSVLLQRGMGYQQDRCFAIPGSWDPGMLSLSHQNSWGTCLNTSVFKFLPFHVMQVCVCPCQLMVEYAKGRKYWIKYIPNFTKKLFHWIPNLCSLSPIIPFKGFGAQWR